MRKKRVEKFATGDIVFVRIPKGKKKGEYVGRVGVRESTYFDIKTEDKKLEGISYTYCRVIARNDGYGYSYQKSKRIATE